MRTDAGGARDTIRAATVWAAVPAVAAAAALVLAAAGPYPSAARGAGALARPGGAAGSPEQTVRPPAGVWRTAHGPSRTPLWATDPPRLNGVHVLDTPAGVIGYAVGTRGTVARLQDGAWQKMTVDELDPRRTTPLVYDLNDLFVIAPDDVWVVGTVTGDRQCGTDACGALVHYDGRRWQVIERTSYGLPGRVPPMQAIDMLQDGSGNWFGWIVGDDLTTDTLKALILRFKDGKWRVWSGPNNFARHLRDVKLVSPGEAWLVGDFGIESWYTERENGVGDWAALGKSGADDLFAVDLADAQYGWDGGDGGRMNHYYGQCHDATLDTQCWFDNKSRPIEHPDRPGLAVSQDVYGIDLLSRTDGWLVGAPSARRSLVAWLEGATQSWFAADVDGDQGTSLFALHMLDTRRGYAVGDKGTIVEYRDESVPTPTLSPTAAPGSATPTAQPTHTPTITPTASAPGDTATPSATARPTRTASATSAPPTTTVTSTATPPSTTTPTATVARGAPMYLPFALKPRRR